MVPVLKEVYFSKADAYIMPLTGLKKVYRYKINSYLFWNKYSIHDYNLILEVCYDDYKDFMDFCRAEIFPVLDKKAYLIESYDFPGRSVFVLDLSEWAMDIQQFIAGKYSKLNPKTKELIHEFHEEEDGIPISIYATLYPRRKMASLDGVNPIEYVAKHYEMDLDVLYKIGEIGSKYQEDEEVLLTDLDAYMPN